MPREFSHIGTILVVWLVSQVRCDLALSRAAADSKTIDAAGHRRRVMPSCDAVTLDLVTAASSGRLNGMEIDAPAVRMTEGQSGGQPVSFYQEATGLEDPATCGNGVRMYDKVKIVMLPGLTPQQRVNSPAPVDPGLHPCGLKLAEHG